MFSLSSLVHEGFNNHPSVILIFLFQKNNTRVKRCWRLFAIFGLGSGNRVGVYIAFLVSSTTGVCGDKYGYIYA